MLWREYTDVRMCLMVVIRKKRRVKVAVASVSEGFVLKAAT